VDLIEQRAYRTFKALPRYGSIEELDRLMEKWWFGSLFIVIAGLLVLSRDALIMGWLNKMRDRAVWETTPEHRRPVILASSIYLCAGLIGLLGVLILVGIVQLTPRAGA
jgi:hypothetical protein